MAKPEQDIVVQVSICAIRNGNFHSAPLTMTAVEQTKDTFHEIEKRIAKVFTDLGDEMVAIRAGDNKPGQPVK